ncbi:MAG: flavodoxin family protein [Oscillospiraceae bacterium]|nr:flavodoxin family protein [Oscillospiraceae bacterium]
MKTLILNGSPRIGGDTERLLNVFRQKLEGECKTVDAYRCGISPCVDCRYCRENEGCAIDDEMQQVYRYIEECDNVLIASPIYFSELTGKLLDVGSRFQMYFCAAFFRKAPIKIKPKKGGIILVGGGDGAADKGESTAKVLLHQINCFDIHPAVLSHNTNNLPAIEDENAVTGARRIAEFFNGKSAD